MRGRRAPQADATLLSHRAATEPRRCDVATETPLDCEGHADTGYRTLAERQGYAWIPQDGRFARGSGTSWRTEAARRSPDTPVTMVALVDAVAFAQWLNGATVLRCDNTPLERAATREPHIGFHVVVDAGRGQ